MDAKKITWIVVLLAGLSVDAVAAGNVYRWIDDNGNVQYSKALPPDAKNRPYDVLSSSGILIERVTEPEVVARPPSVDKKTDGKPKGPVPLYSDEEKAKISDRLLLIKYRNEQEILDAMQLEIDHLKYDERILESNSDSVYKSLVGQIESAANRQRAGLPVESVQIGEIENLRKRLKDNRTSIMAVESRKDSIRKRFEADLVRYRELVKLYDQSG